MSSYLIVEESPLLEMAYELGMERTLFLDDDDAGSKKKSLEWKARQDEKAEDRDLDRILRNKGYGVPH